jgi:heme exporter protein D
MVRFRTALVILLMYGKAAFAEGARAEFAAEMSSWSSSAVPIADGQVQSPARPEITEFTNAAPDQAALIATALEKIANSIATPPDPVSRQLARGFFWFVYPWQTFVAATLAFAAVLFQIGKQERWRLADIRRERKARVDAARRQKWAFLKALENQTRIANRDLADCKRYLRDLGFEEFALGTLRHPRGSRLSWIRPTAPALINDWERLAELPLDAAEAAFQFQASIMRILALVDVYVNAPIVSVAIEFDMTNKIGKEIDVAIADGVRLVGRIEVAKIGLEPVQMDQ